MSAKRILITAGGTGGHLYPAQALAQQLMKEEVVPEIFFVAGGLRTNRYFDRDRFSHQEILCSPLISRNPKQCFKGLIHLVKGIKQSVKILNKFQPDVVVGFGSYYTVPILIAASWLKIPIVLHEANSIPGKANRWLAPLASCIGLHFPSAKKFFNKARTFEVGLPLREGYQFAAISKGQALDYFGLTNERKTLLICGGSQGAKAINEIMSHCLPIFSKLDLQIIHLTGSDEMAKHLSSMYASHQIPSKVKAFESQMQMAWCAADGFIGRSGASTIAEAIEFEVPGLLIPYPHATDQHQEKNADFLVDTVGAAWKINELNLVPTSLTESIESFFQDSQHAIFKKALEDYKKRPHQLTLAELVLNLNTYIGRY